MPIFTPQSVVLHRVAKTRFASATDAVPVLRGGSRSPLFVSAAGMPADVAAAHVALMHGAYRVPALLKQVDALARASRPRVVTRVRFRQHRSSRWRRAGMTEKQEMVG